MTPNVRQCLGLFVLLLFAGASAYAGDASLTVCNKGSVEVDVVVALKTDWLVATSLHVQAWFAIGPGDCQLVYDEGGIDDDGGHPAYIGFGVTDSHKHFTARHIDQLPDFGRYGRFRSGEVLTRSERRLCVREGKTAYTINKDQDIDCASFHSDGNDPGGYFSFASQLYFMPVPKVCSSYGFIGQVRCAGGEYYLNVKPAADDRELHASMGSESGKDQSPVAESDKSLPTRPFTHFVDGCNAFYRDPANSKYASLDDTAWCSCLGEHYRNVMSPAEESRYANDYGRLFRGGIEQPQRNQSDPAWPRLHPVVDDCIRIRSGP